MFFVQLMHFLLAVAKYCLAIVYLCPFVNVRWKVGVQVDWRVWRDGEFQLEVHKHVRSVEKSFQLKDSFSYPSYGGSGSFFIHCFSVLLTQKEKK